MQFFINGPSKGNSKIDEEWVSFEDIRLEGGFAPSIMQEVVKVTGLEPALWFKVLLVDAAAIDIEGSTLQWTTCKKRNCKQRQRSYKPFTTCCHSQESFFRSDHTSLELDMAQGLEIASDILRDKTNKELDVLRLLHVYVLPQIKFTKNDDPLFDGALMKQQNILQDLDNQLDILSDERKSIKDTLRIWRRDICSNLQDDGDISKCNIQFLKLLCMHLEMDMKAAYAEIEMYSDQLDDLKRRVEKRTSNDSLQDLLQELDDLRQERNRVAEHLDAALYVHEEVKLLEEHNLLRGNLELTDSQKGYVKTEELWKKYCRDIMEVHKRKVCAVSVREALLNTRKEVAEVGETSGPEIAADGTGYSTDIHVSGELPLEWQSLQTQVTNVVETNVELNELHRNFYAKVEKTLREELQGQPNVGKIKRSIRLPNSFRTAPHDERVAMLRKSLKERKPNQHFIAVGNQLQAEILQHFEKMVPLLKEDRDAPSKSFSQLWVCYERCLFPELFSQILRLYVYAYGPQVKVLKRKLPDLKPSDLDLDDEWLLNILGLYPLEDKKSDLDVNKNSKDETDQRERLESGVIVDQKRERRLRRFTAIIDGNCFGQEDQSEQYRRSCSLDIDALTIKDKRKSQVYTNFPKDLNFLKVPLESKLSRRHTSPHKPRIKTCPLIISSSDPQVGGIDDSGIHSDHISPAMEAYEDSIDAVDSSLSTSQGKEYIPMKRRPSSKAVKEFQERFSVAYKSFEEVVDASVPITKMQWLYRCLQQVNNIAQKQAELLFCGKRSMLSGDDLLTALILFLLYGNPGIITAFYPQLQFLQDYMPDFLSKGEFGFTVTQFVIAFNYILRSENSQQG